MTFKNLPLPFIDCLEAEYYEPIIDSCLCVIGTERKTEPGRCGSSSDLSVKSLSLPSPSRSFNSSDIYFSIMIKRMSMFTDKIKNIFNITKNNQFSIISEDQMNFTIKWNFEKIGWVQYNMKCSSILDSSWKFFSISIRGKSARFTFCDEPSVSFDIPENRGNLVESYSDLVINGNATFIRELLIVKGGWDINEKVFKLHG
jgi:hypothetical protein